MGTSRKPETPARPCGRPGSSAADRAWTLEDARAKLDEVVRLACEEGPQRVTMHGDDAVVVVSAGDFARLVAAPVQETGLHALLSGSPLKDLDFGSPGDKSPVRDVDL